MEMFDLTTTSNIKESGKVIGAGIHTAKFVAVKYNTFTSQNNGNTYNTMQLVLDIDGYGEHTSSFFEPTSAERTQSQFGENPSPVEHFMVAVRQIVDALDPAIGKAIDENNVVVKEKKVNVKNLNFSQLVKLIGLLTEPYAGTEVEVKLIPQSNGFNAIPGFPARITRQGTLGISTRFIGHNLVLNQSEQRKIDSANTAQPTNMRQQESGSVDGLADVLGIDLDEEKSSDLPF